MKTSIFHFTALVGLLAIGSITYGCISPVINDQHYLVYDVMDIPEHGDNVLISDEFFTDPIAFDPIDLTHFVTPVEKRHDDSVYAILHKNHHATLYLLQPEIPVNKFVTVENQFGRQVLLIGSYRYLFTPAGKETGGNVYERPKDLDHYMLYEILEQEGAKPATVTLTDQFIEGMPTAVATPKYYGVPANKQHGGMDFEIQDSYTKLVFFQIDPLGPNPLPDTTVVSDDQLGVHELDFRGRVYLGVPSKMLKTSDRR